MRSIRGAPRAGAPPANAARANGAHQRLRMRELGHATVFALGDAYRLNTKAQTALPAGASR